jgi:hypothetical protein
MWILIGLAAAILAQAQQPAGAAAKPYGLPLHGEEAETFLQTAKVVDKKPIGTGVTGSMRLTLNDGAHTFRAAWKTIDESRPGATEMAGGTFKLDVRDSYKCEIAAYELDKLIGLDLVPPTVERQVEGQHGSLQLWVEGVTTEYERISHKVRIPDAEAWNEQMYKVRLLHRLTYNTDYQNLRNVLVDPGFRIYAIDFSRAFRKYDMLQNDKGLARFSRSALEGLRRLDRPTLDAKLGRWLSPAEILAILQRRDRILTLAQRLVKEKGEDAVLYP